MKGTALPETLLVHSSIRKGPSFGQVSPTSECLQHLEPSMGANSVPRGLTSPWFSPGFLSPDPYLLLEIFACTPLSVWEPSQNIWSWRKRPDPEGPAQKTNKTKQNKTHRKQGKIVQCRKYNFIFFKDTALLSAQKAFSSIDHTNCSLV